MTNSALMVLQVLFQSIWRLFTSWHIPGTNVTPAVMALFLLSAVFTIKFVKMVFFNDSGKSGDSF